MSLAGAEALKMWNGGRAPRSRVQGRGLSLSHLCGLRVLPRENVWKQVQMCAICCILWVKYAFMGVQDRGVHGIWFSWESHGNGNSHIGYKGNGNKRSEKVYKRLHTKLPLNRAVPVPVRGILTIPPWDTKLNSSGGIRSSSDQDVSPRPAYKYHPVRVIINLIIIRINSLGKVNA